VTILLLKLTIKTKNSSNTFYTQNVNAYILVIFYAALIRAKFTFEDKKIKTEKIFTGAQKKSPKNIASTTVETLQNNISRN
jgi:hypothetical protein